MNTPVSIRQCTAGDLPALGLHEPPNSRIAAGFLDRQTAGDVIYATAWTGEAPHGGAVLDFRAGPVPELKNLFVYPGSRRAGIGRALCLWLEEQARLAGHSGIILGVESGNAAARNLYEDLGYRTTGDVSTYSYEYLDTAGNRTVATETAEMYRKPLAAPAAVDAPTASKPTQTEPSRAKFEMRTAWSTASPSTVNSCDPGRKVPCHSCPSAMPTFMQSSPVQPFRSCHCRLTRRIASRTCWAASSAFHR